MMDYVIEAFRAGLINSRDSRLAYTVDAFNALESLYSKEELRAAFAKNPLMAMHAVAMKDRHELKVLEAFNVILDISEQVLINETHYLGYPYLRISKANVFKDYYNHPYLSASKFILTPDVFMTATVTIGVAQTFKITKNLDEIITKDLLAYLKLRKISAPTEADELLNYCTAHLEKKSLQDLEATTSRTIKL